MSIQNIVNVCFAICITLLIYQNTQLKESIDEIWEEKPSEWRVMELAENRAKYIAERCEVSGYVDNGYAQKLSIECNRN